MLRQSDLQRMMNGGFKPDRLPVIHGLLPAIINDMNSYADRFVDHPIRLADFLLWGQPKLRLHQFIGVHGVGHLPLWDRVILVSDRYLRDKPFAVRVDERIILRQHL